MKNTTIFLVLLLAFLPCSAWPSPKHALVIGNGAYERIPLRCPVNDANDMSAALRKTGFAVTTKIEVGQEAMEQAIDAFGKQLQPGDVALFYFSGHGVQIDGNNYLIPVDLKIASEEAIRYKAVRADFVLAVLEKAESRVNIIILDACRDNPFKSLKSAAQGLAQMAAPSGKLAGTVIAYATAPGRTARDGQGRNSPYTRYLLEAMAQPGLKIEEVFKYVRQALRQETNETQTPWESSSLLDDFYFIPPDAAALSTPISAAPPLLEPTPQPEFSPLPNPAGESHTIAALIVNAQKEIDWNMTQQVAAAFQHAGHQTVTPPFFSAQFVRNGAFEQLFQGNPAAAKKLRLSEYCDYAIFGKADVSFLDNPDLADIITANISLEFHAINSRAGSAQGSLSLAAKGAGFSENDARHAAMQAIGEQLEAQVSQLLKK